MQKSFSKYALIALFLGMLFIPGIIGLVAGDRVKTTNNEKRALATMPVFSWETISDFPHDCEVYYADNQPFRDQLIFVRAFLNKTLYDRDILNKVSFGKEGWLFYTIMADGNPAENYRGEDLYDLRELREIATHLEKTRSNLAKKGCDFVLFIAPNKERMYSEYMPDRYGAPADEYAVQQLVNYLRQRTKVKVVYPYEELMAAKQEFPDVPVYYSKDTHWNYVGSYIGTRALMRELGVELPALTRDMIETLPPERDGDLTLMTHLENILPRDAEYTVSEAVLSTLPDIAKASSINGKTLYIQHDSFEGYMEGYLLDLFQEGGVYASWDPDNALVDQVQPDIFVMEVVERFSQIKLPEGPLYPAPNAD